MESILKLLLATILGTLLGLERELKNKPAGIRTCAIITLSSCLITLLSIYMYEQYPTHTDPTRLAANIITGIGWIGTGVIVHQGASTAGLTTAAAIFGAMAIGLACGAGAYTLAITGTILLLSIVLGFNKLKQFTHPKDTHRD